MKQKPKYSKNRTKRKLKRKSNRRTKRRPNRRTKRKSIRKNMRGGSAGWWQRCCWDTRPKDPPPWALLFETYPDEVTTINYLDKFYEELPKESLFSTTKYRLKVDKLRLISCHGRVMDNRYIVVPEGLTLYSFCAAGTCVDSNLHDSTYIRVHPPGSLIQDHKLDFVPFFSSGESFDGGDHPYYQISGLLKDFIPPDPPVQTARRIDTLLRALGWWGYRGGGGILSSSLPDAHNISLHRDTYYEYNMDDIISKDNLLRASNISGDWTSSLPPFRSPPGQTLGWVLMQIAAAVKNRPREDVGADWFGAFCRAGEVLNIETLKRCAVTGFDRLPSEFFDSNVSFEGVSPDQRLDDSLASKSQTSNFMNTVNALVEYSEKYTFPEIGGGRDRLKTIADKLSRTNKQEIGTQREMLDLDPDKYTLETWEVCFIFQMKNHIIQNWWS